MCILRDLPQHKNPRVLCRGSSPSLRSTHTCTRTSLTTLEPLEHFWNPQLWGGEPNEKQNPLIAPSIHPSIHGGALVDAHSPLPWNCTWETDRKGFKSCLKGGRLSLRFFLNRLTMRNKKGKDRSPNKKTTPERPEHTMRSPRRSNLET